MKLILQLFEIEFFFKDYIFNYHILNCYYLVSQKKVKKQIRLTNYFLIILFQFIQLIKKFEINK